MTVLGTHHRIWRRLPTGKYEELMSHEPYGPTIPSTTTLDWFPEQTAKLREIMEKQIKLIVEKDNHYRGSWMLRGGLGAFFTLVRPWDRFEALLKNKYGYDIFDALVKENGSREDGSILACIYDIRSYLLLAEAWFLLQKNPYTAVEEARREHQNSMAGLHDYDTPMYPNSVGFNEPPERDDDPPHVSLVDDIVNGTAPEPREMEKAAAIRQKKLDATKGRCDSCSQAYPMTRSQISKFLNCEEILCPGSECDGQIIYLERDSNYLRS